MQEVAGRNRIELAGPELPEHLRGFGTPAGSGVKPCPTYSAFPNGGPRLLEDPRAISKGQAELLREMSEDPAEFHGGARQGHACRRPARAAKVHTRDAPRRFLLARATGRNRGALPASMPAAEEALAELCTQQPKRRIVWSQRPLCSGVATGPVGSTR